MAERKCQIVVGVDETAASKTALRWAIAEAPSRDCAVRIVAVAGASASVPFSPPRLLEERFNDAIGIAYHQLPAARVSGALLSGRPAELILSESHGADLLVLGSPGHSALGGVFLGSVSAAAAAHATCPVMIVREPRLELDETPTVMVGVDGSPPSLEALGFAFDHASAHGRQLTVLFCLDVVDPHGRSRGGVAERREAARAWLTSLVAPYAEKAPDVPVTTRVVDGRPTKALASLSRGARLVVVGSRGHGGITGMLLGSVSQHLLHHAHCNVAITRGATA